MRAMSYRVYGGPLEPADVERPKPQAEQILIRARHSSVNPIDWKMASGKYRLIMPVKLPAIPGFDVAGEVAEVGPGVTGFNVGDRVHARVLGRTGEASAEYVLAGVDVVAPVPAKMPLDVAAALPLAGMTALQGLRDEARMPMTNAKDRVLVVGASGGVGQLAVQIAKAAGATVTTTRSRTRSKGKDRGTLYWIALAVRLQRGRTSLCLGVDLRARCRGRL